jgi:hypothetical protein
MFGSSAKKAAINVATSPHSAMNRNEVGASALDYNGVVSELVLSVQAVERCPKILVTQALEGYRLVFLQSSLGSSGSDCAV